VFKLPGRRDSAHCQALPGRAAGSGWPGRGGPGALAVRACQAVPSRREPHLDRDSGCPGPGRRAAARHCGTQAGRLRLSTAAGWKCHSERRSQSAGQGSVDSVLPTVTAADRVGAPTRTRAGSGTPAWQGLTRRRQARATRSLSSESFQCPPELGDRPGHAGLDSMIVLT
jgi:hypothetical protein